MASNFFFPEGISQVSGQPFNYLFEEEYRVHSPLTVNEIESCKGCGDFFEESEQIVLSNGRWHQECFVCAQCFQPFPSGIFFEYDGKNFCEHDFQMLYAPYCSKCQNFILGRRIRANNSSWHPHCFCCEICSVGLSDKKFRVFMDKSLCDECYTKEKAEYASRIYCQKCKGPIDKNGLKHNGEYYHAYHFDCCTCGCELTESAKEKNSKLWCLRCYDRAGASICGACRRPIEERIVIALGKEWHPEHFVCSICERPFLGSRFFEHEGHAYCVFHYHQISGNLCHFCLRPIESGNLVEFCHKSFCTEHFTCTGCGVQLQESCKTYPIDLKPFCKHCMESLPKSYRKRLAKMHKDEDHMESKWKKITEDVKQSHKSGHSG